MMKEGAVDIFFSDAAKEKEILYGVRSAFIGAGFVAGVTRSPDGRRSVLATDGLTIRETFPRSARVFFCIPFSVSGEFFSTVLSDAKEGTFVRDQLQTIIAQNEPRESTSGVPLALYIYEKLFSGKVRWWCFEFVEGDVKQMFVLLQSALAALPSRLHPDYLDRLSKVFFRYREGEWRLMDMITIEEAAAAEEAAKTAALPGKPKKKAPFASREHAAHEGSPGTAASAAEEPLLTSFLRSLFPKGEGVIALVNPIRDIRLLFRCARVCVREAKFPTGAAAFGLAFAKWLVIVFVFKTTFSIF